MGFFSSFAVDRVADQLAGATDRAVRLVVERRGPAIERAAERLRREDPSASPAELARRATQRRATHVAGAGAVSALPGLVPFVGTTTEIGAAVGDVSLLTLAQVELVLLVAALHGLPLDDHEQRRLDVLLVLGVEAGAVKLRRDGSLEVLGTRYRPGELGENPASGLAARVTRLLAQKVVARLARRRAQVVLGRAIPVVGVGIAAGYNLWSTRSLGGTAIEYCERVGGARSAA